MKRTLDIEKVDAALKRAAFKATHGARTERAGRFLAAKAPRPDRSSQPDLKRHKA